MKKPIETINSENTISRNVIANQYTKAGIYIKGVLNIESNMVAI